MSFFVNLAVSTRLYSNLGFILRTQEREKKMDFIPERSELQVESIDCSRDQVLKQMIKDLGVRRLVPQMNKDNRRGGPITRNNKYD